MHGVEKMNVVPRDSFPPFPLHYVPSRPHLTSIFIKDYWQNKNHIMWELHATVINHALVIDHQRKVVRHTLGGGVVDRGRRTSTICGDYGLVCGVYVVPGTSLSWTQNAMDEVIDCHRSIGLDVPRSLYTDCGCYSGSLRTLSTNTALTSIMGMWPSTFKIKLDMMHLMLRIGREINAEHPRRKKISDRFEPSHFCPTRSGQTEINECQRSCWPGRFTI